MLICADVGIAGINEYLASKKVQLVLAPAGAGGKREDRLLTQELYSDAGREKYFELLQTVFLPGRTPIECLKYRRTIAAVNLCGYDGRRHYHAGHGSITNAMGEVVALIQGLPNLDRQRPMYAHADIDVEDCLQASP